MRKSVYLLFIGAFVAFYNYGYSQVATSYTFTQDNGIYTPLVAAFPSTPASIFSTSWADIGYTGYTLPFSFYYNGVTYPAGTVIGLDTDAWIAFNPGTMTGQLASGSWVSASLSDGKYLYGDANNNGYAGFNADLHHQDFATITGKLQNGSRTISNLNAGDFTNIRIGTRLIHTLIPDGTVVTAFDAAAKTITMSANATGNNNSAAITPSASIYAMTTGTAPNRKFVIQWTQVQRYTVYIDGTGNDNFSFQMILEEGGGSIANQSLKVMFGSIVTAETEDLLLQIGLRGNSGADFNARKSNSSWAATTASAANTDVVALKNGNVPASGLTFIWTPVCTSMTAPGAIAGTNPICLNQTYDYSIPAVTGAAYYTWSYSGTGATFAASTISPVNSISFASDATAGTLSVTPGNPCGSGSAAAMNITLNSSVQILSSSGASRCGTGSVSLTATTGAGNIINWYTAASGGNSVSTGSTFNTPSLASTTSYYVNAEQTGTGVTAILGNGATTPSSYEGVFDHLYGGCQTQFLVKASELLAAGLRTGNITRLGIRFSSVTPQSYNGFAISMQQTSTADMSGGLNTSAFTSVYSAASVTPATGVNNYILSAPFSWDGSSNIIIKLCWSNNNTGGTDNYVQVDATSYVSGAYYRADNQTPAAICGATSATGTVSSRPQFYFAGTGVTCSSARTEVVATINPLLSSLTMNPTAATICTGQPAQALTFTGGTYTSGTVNAYTQGFETFPASNFAASGGVTAASGTTYYAEGAKSAYLTYGNSLTVAGNNAYALTTNINLSTYTAATLSFKHICALEGYSTTYDAGYVQYSTNGGGAWTTFPASSYAGSGTLINDIDGSTVTGTIFSTKSYLDWISRFTGAGITPGTSPAAALWKTETINIPAAALTSQFRIRFLIVSDASVNYYGWLIDDIKIIVPGTAVAPAVWTPNGAGTGLYSDTSATIVYTGSATTTVYAKPTITTTYTATGTAPGGCTAANTVAVTVKPGNTWLGINTNWSDPVNWCPGVPTLTTDVTVSAGVPNMPVLSGGTGTVRNLTMSGGATLTVTDATMQIAGAITTAPGSINASNGTIELAGSSAQSISGSSFTGRTIQNVKASNSVNVSNAASDSLRITGVLSFGSVNSKTFNSGDNVILVSSATGTARVADITNNGANNGNTFSGKFTVQRYIPARRAWRLMTAPVAAGEQTINQAWQESAGGTWSNNPYPGYGTHISGGPARNGGSPGNGYDIGPRDPSIYGYSGTAWNYLPANTGEMITSRQGWMLFVRGSRAINLPLSTPSTVPDITILRPKGAIKYNTQPAVTNPSGGFMVVGNPYPSPINFNKLTRSGIIGGMGGNNAYYLWDPGLDGSNGVGGYVSFSWNSGTGKYDRSVLTGSGPAEIADNGIIPSSAAFMVNTNAGAGIIAEENDKDTIVYGNSYLFRPATVPSSLRATLYEIEPDGSKAVSDGNLITFSASSSNEVDMEDAVKPANIWENFGILHNGARISIERKDLPAINDTIFYYMWNMQRIGYELEIAAENLEIPAGATAFLEDIYLHRKTMLGNSDTTRINFAVTADTASQDRNRFRVIIAPVVVLPVTFTDIKAYPAGDDVNVEWTVENEINVKQYEVEHSADGIHFSSINNTEAKGGNITYHSLDEKPATGYNYYRVKSISNDGEIKYSRIVKVYLDKNKPSITVYPNPVKSGCINLAFNYMKSGHYAAKLYNSTGQLVFSKQLTLMPGSTTETLQLQTKMANGAYQLAITGQDGKRKTFKLVVDGK